MYPAFIFFKITEIIPDIGFFIFCLDNGMDCDILGCVTKQLIERCYGKNK